jgi:hypothetical protein
LPAPRKTRNTRGYTKTEIAKLLKFCGPRETALVLGLTSTAMRIEAFAELRMKHLQKIEEYGIYKITVYELDPHEYTCFTTPEAAQAFDDYIAYRRRHGEKLSREETPEAPLIREEFDTEANDENNLKIRYPQKMRPQALGDIIRFRLQKAGIVDRMPMQERQRPGQKRNLIPRSHGFRRFAITAMINAEINSDIRNMLTDHSIKLDKNYYHPTEEKILQEYLKVVDDLTINEEKKLRRENEILRKENDQVQELQRQMTGLYEKLGLENPSDMTPQIKSFKLQGERVERTNEALLRMHKGFKEQPEAVHITREKGHGDLLDAHDEKYIIRKMRNTRCCTCRRKLYDAADYQKQEATTKPSLIQCPECFAKYPHPTGNE